MWFLLILPLFLLGCSSVRERYTRRDALIMLHDGLWRDDSDYRDDGGYIMSCPEIVFQGIDQTLYTRLLSQATSAGVSFDGDKASMSGIEFDWTYDPQSNNLHITCTKKPFFIGCGTIQEKLTQLIQESRSAI